MTNSFVLMYFRLDRDLCMLSAASQHNTSQTFIGRMLCVQVSLSARPFQNSCDLSKVIVSPHCDLDILASVYDRFR